jgi:hypothetical protein
MNATQLALDIAKNKKSVIFGTFKGLGDTISAMEMTRPGPEISAVLLTENPTIS